MFTEKGTLPNGVEFNGVTHRDFEIREQIVADSINVFDDPEQAERAMKNQLYANLCVTANMFLSLGTIPKKEITADLLMDALQEDQNEISDAEKRLAIKRLNFRKEKEKQPPTDTPAS
ncbi:MAG: hypothetical protein ABSC11_03450 [Smithella sp.]|jgi:hypothetical protein